MTLGEARVAGRVVEGNLVPVVKVAVTARTFYIYAGTATMPS